MAKLTFEIEGQKVISRNFRILADEITEMKPEFEEIGQIMLDGSLDNFETEGSETGGKWKNLAPATIMARKKRLWYYKNAPSWASASGPILQWTGNLKNSLFKESGDLYALVWNAAPYFKYHQTKNRGSWNLPRRLILEIRETNKLKIQNTIAKGINKRVWNFWKRF